MNLDSKIKLFSKMINEKIENEKLKSLEVFNKEKEEILQKQKLKLESLREERINSVNKRAELMVQELIAKSKFEKQKSVMNLKKQFVEEIYTEVKKRMSLFVQTEEYKKYVLECVRRTLSELENGSYVIYMLDSDLISLEDEINKIVSEYNGISARLEHFNKDIIGGFILEEEGKRFKIDESLLKKLNRSEETIGLYVEERFNEGG